MVPLEEIDRSVSRARDREVERRENLEHPEEARRLSVLSRDELGSPAGLPLLVATERAERPEVMLPDPRALLEDRVLWYLTGADEAAAAELGDDSGVSVRPGQKPSLLETPERRDEGVELVPRELGARECDRRPGRKVTCGSVVELLDTGWH